MQVRSGRISGRNARIIGTRRRSRMGMTSITPVHLGCIHSCHGRAMLKKTKIGNVKTRSSASCVRVSFSRR